MSRKMLVVRYVRSCIGYPERQKRTLHALGLKRLGDQVEVAATGRNGLPDAVQGMLRKIEHLVEVTDRSGEGMGEER